MILTGLVTGAIGALLMNLMLRWISATFAEPLNMVEVLGSFFNSDPRRAIFIGTVLHFISGAVFGILYVWFLYLIGAHKGLTPLFAGVGMGFFHGLLVSYILMFFVRDTHPIENFRRASFQVGVFYLFAHVVYGGFVGAATGIIGLL